jgi:hypothetical protein
MFSKFMILACLSVPVDLLLSARLLPIIPAFLRYRLLSLSKHFYNDWLGTIVSNIFSFLIRSAIYSLSSRVCCLPCLDSNAHLNNLEEKETNPLLLPHIFLMDQNQDHPSCDSVNNGSLP